MVYKIFVREWKETLFLYVIPTIKSRYKQQRRRFYACFKNTSAVCPLIYSYTIYTYMGFKLCGFQKLISFPLGKGVFIPY